MTYRILSNTYAASHKHNVTNKQIKHVDKNRVLIFSKCNGSNKSRLESKLFESVVSTFRMNIQISDIVQGVHRTPNGTKIIKIFYEFSKMYERLKIIKELISSPNNSTYKNLRQDRAKKRNCSESQDSPKVMNKFIFIS